MPLTLSGLNLPCHLHPLRAASCCRNSRLVVDEDDLKKIVMYFDIFVKQFLKNYPCKNP